MKGKETMSAHKKKASEKASKALLIRLTPGEHRTLLAMAKRDKCSASQVLRGRLTPPKRKKARKVKPAVEEAGK